MSKNYRALVAFVLCAAVVAFATQCGGGGKTSGAADAGDSGVGETDSGSGGAAPTAQELQDAVTIEGATAKTGDLPPGSPDPSKPQITEITLPDEVGPGKMFQVNVKFHTGTATLQKMLIKLQGAAGYFELKVQAVPDTDGEASFPLMFELEQSAALMSGGYALTSSTAKALDDVTVTVTLLVQLTDAEGLSGMAQKDLFTYTTSAGACKGEGCPVASDAGQPDGGPGPDGEIPDAAACVPTCAGKCGGGFDGCGDFCPDPCNGHGTCYGGGCTCNTGYQAPACDSCDSTSSGYPDCTWTWIGSCAPSPSGKGGDVCLVPAGEFMMGCNVAVDAECQSQEDPYHRVNVPGFRIDKHEVTAAEYKACVTDGSCTPAITTFGCNYEVAGKESHPINCVDWDQARAYCAWAGKRLPAEAEREKAARGTDGRKYPWGNNPLDCTRAVTSVSPCSNAGTAAVGSKPDGASPYGAEDLIGNVYEWAEDDWHDGYIGAPADGTAWVETPHGPYRVVRSGSWFDTDPIYLRSSNRNGIEPVKQLNNVGLRCAMPE